MKNMKRIFPVLCLFFLLPGCQKDDICPGDTEITPLLIIEFYDQEDPTRLKAVPGLLVHAPSQEDTLFGPENVNRIEIPLRTDQNTTEYRFVRNSGTATENEDIITFFYNPSPEYLNRACGFVVNYLGMEASTVDDENNWIISESVQQINVENETEEAHIYLMH